MDYGSIAAEPAHGPAVWHGAGQRPSDWVVPLDQDDCAELVRAAGELGGRPARAREPRGLSSVAARSGVRAGRAMA